VIAKHDPGAQPAASHPVTTDSGIPVAPVYTAEDVAGGPDALAGRLGRPGEPPFTRGPYESMYRGQLWTMRQFAGYGSPEETNARFHFLLGRGQTALSVAFDLPTQLGYDSDHRKILASASLLIAMGGSDSRRQLLELVAHKSCDKFHKTRLFGFPGMCQMNLSCAPGNFVHFIRVVKHVFDTPSKIIRIAEFKKIRESSSK